MYVYVPPKTTSESSVMQQLYIKIIMNSHLDKIYHFSIWYKLWFKATCGTM